MMSISKCNPTEELSVLKKTTTKKHSTHDLYFLLVQHLFFFSLSIWCSGFCSDLLRLQRREQCLVVTKATDGGEFP